MCVWTTTTSTLFSCQACHSKGAAAKKQRGNSSGSSSDSNVHFRQSKLRVLCVIPTVQPVPVQHHVAAAAAAQVASSFEFELVGILQRATHSLAPLLSSQWGHSASFHCLFIRCALSLPLRPPLAVPFLLLLLCLVSLLFFSPHSSWRLFIYPQLYPWHASRTVQGSKAASRRGCYISRPQPSVRLYSF